MYNKPCDKRFRDFFHLGGLSHSNSLFMKKIVALVLLSGFVLFPSFVWAQKSLGIKAGINLASATNLGKSGFFMGPAAGFFAEYRINPFFAFQPELMYSQQGANAADPYYFRADYINIPLLVKLFPVNNIFIEMGPQFAFCIKAKGTSLVEGNQVVYNTVDELNPIDLNVACGIGFEMAKGPMISARYYIGMLAVDRNGAIDGRSGENHNSVIQLSIGWKF
jgi:hypothetical protein